MFPKDCSSLIRIIILTFFLLKIIILCRIQSLIDLMKLSSSYPNSISISPEFFDNLYNLYNLNIFKLFKIDSQTPINI